MECGGMSENGPGQDPNSAEDPRLGALDERLRRASEAERARTGTSARAPEKGYKQGSRVLAELIAGPAGGALIGWWLDRLLGTGHWLLLALMFLGTAAAFWNIVKISKQRPE
jgi:ATP synthase protein I